MLGRERSKAKPAPGCRSPPAQKALSPAAELDAKMQWLVDRIADKSPTAIRRGKYAMRALEAMSFDEGIAYTESQIALLAMTEDAKEGLASFNEKRRPTWTGR